MALVSRRIVSSTSAGLLCMILMAPIGAAAQVPFVGCKSDGQMGPQPAPKKAGRIPAVPKELAGRLAYYKSRDLGVLGPRGWKCFGVYGSNGSSLLVTPGPHRPEEVFDGNLKLTGPAIQLSLFFGGTSGRSEVASIAARLFPSKRGFVQNLINEDLISKDDVEFGPYPADILKRRSDTVVEYETPAGQDGMGTQSFLEKNSSPIRGIAIMTDEDDAVRLTVRVPAEAEFLVPTIVDSTAAMFVKKAPRR